jgi:hypothetical protein
MIRSAMRSALDRLLRVFDDNELDELAYGD